MPPDSHIFQPPRGTRDFYPLEAARRRWLLDKWREVSTRHGFEEIDGPTFEHLDLYRRKSGDALVGEAFRVSRLSADAGQPQDASKSDAETSDELALRPEFTPTLARMYAAKAASLPKPTKWFCVSNFFRAERPQRGRLREFWQWNVDCMGLDIPEAEWGNEETKTWRSRARADAEVIICAIELLNGLGLGPGDFHVAMGSRPALEAIARSREFAVEHLDRVFALLDEVNKLDEAQFRARAIERGLDPERMMEMRVIVASPGFQNPAAPANKDDQTAFADSFVGEIASIVDEAALSSSAKFEEYEHAWHLVRQYGYGDWIRADLSIARGLAYYTGTVFEVIAEGERAVAGGGRYDNLIELFGGPPTPAVGFGMGDAVLSLLLQDKGLMPSDTELMRHAGQTPDVFVLNPADEAAEAQLRPTVARLRAAGIHARHTYRSTRNVGKLMKEAVNQGARLALILEPGGTHAKIKALADSSETEPMLLDAAIAKVSGGVSPDNA